MEKILSLLLKVILVMFNIVLASASEAPTSDNPSVLWTSKTGLCAKAFTGEEARPYFNDIAELRISMFKEFPYLYEGSIEYETCYLETYFKSPNSCIILLFDNTKGITKDSAVVGFSSSIPLSEEQEEFKKPFEDNNLNVYDYLYVGELMLLPPYRKQGILRHFETNNYIENSARKRGCSHIVFMTVKRPVDHPFRPADYRSLDSLWESYHYKRLEGLEIHVPWVQVDTHKEELNVLEIWGKSLIDEPEL